MDKIKYFMHNYGFAARKSLSPIIVLTLAIIPLGLIGLVIGQSGSDVGMKLVFQLTDDWCIALSIIIAYCIAPMVQNNSKRYNLSSTYFNVASWGLLLVFCVIMCLMFGLLAVISNLIVYDDAIPLLYNIKLSDLLQAMYALFLYCILFGSVAFVLAKLNSVSKFFLILTAVYAIALLLLNTALRNENFQYIKFYFYQDNLLYLTLMTVPIVAAMIGIDYVITRRVLCQ